MQDPAATGLCAKIARIAEELGWNRQTLARNAGLNRLTIASIFSGENRKLHNETVQACAAAFGLSAGELRTEPLERLRGKVRPERTASELRRRQFEQAMQPELQRWIEANPQRAAELTAEELDELVSMQGVGGPLTAFGVAESVARLERRRRLVRQVIAVAGTEYIDLLESFVAVLFEKVQPYRDRS
jgi:transcriptional regulator with XRE-family HTH domain